jgi:hypothetical protein
MSLNLLVRRDLLLHQFKFVAPKPPSLVISPVQLIDAEDASVVLSAGAAAARLGRPELGIIADKRALVVQDHDSLDVVVVDHGPV